MIPVRQVRAVYTSDTVTVYQAYNPDLGSYAAEHGRFPDTYNRARMTWIKPSFLWMMYRSGWARKHRQERVLAIEITRPGFEWALANAALSHYQPDAHASRQAWAASLRRPVRVQWDPERSLTMRPLAHRALQVGLSGEAVDRFVDSWITGIKDVTGLAHSVHQLVQNGSLDEASALLPKEEPYPLPADIAAPLRA
ncbi:MAG: DUF4291 domain-containing protein [Kibdelosporangium sp.]